MTKKRFHYDWKTGRFKDTQSNSCATSNMRVLETQINNACYNYEKKIKELKKENDILIEQRLGEERLKQEIADYHTSNGRLHRLNNELIRRLDKFNINYLDILEDLND